VCGWSTPRPDHFTPGKGPVPIVQEAGWVPGPVWTGAENLAPTGIRSPDRPSCSKALYRLSYPGPFVVSWELSIYWQDNSGRRPLTGRKTSAESGVSEKALYILSCFNCLLSVQDHHIRHKIACVYKLLCVIYVMMPHTGMFKYKLPNAGLLFATCVNKWSARKRTTAM